MNPHEPETLWAEEKDQNPTLQFFPAHKTDDQNQSPRPCVLVLPGGGYAHLADHEGEPVAHLLNAHGFHSCVVRYRRTPNHFPAPYEDATRAMRLVRSRAQEWNINPDAVGLLGFSAGGHLTSLVGTQPELYHSPEDNLAGEISARPDFLILLYPVISFVSYAHQGSVKNLLGEDLSQQRRLDFSSELHVDGGTPPSFLFHTAEDTGVPVQNSLLFAKALADHGVLHALHVFPKGDHGVGLATEIPELSIWPELMIKWLKEREL